MTSARGRGRESGLAIAPFGEHAKARTANTTFQNPTMRLRLREAAP